MSGYATDYGMYMPMEIPKLSQDTLEQWSQLSYIDIMKELAKIFVGDEVPAEKISGELVMIRSYLTITRVVCYIVNSLVLR